MTCPSISVTSADYAECNGAYSVTDYVVLWAVHRPVYKHVAKDRYAGGVLWMEMVIRIILRYIFWNKGGFGWSIGKKAYLMSGSHWHRSKNVDKVVPV